MKNNVIAIIMAGGIGPTLWPVSTDNLPKQFLSFVGNSTLLQETFERTRKFFDLNKIYIATTENFAPLVKKQVPEIPEHNIIKEPISRHTLPCISLALAKLSPIINDDTVFVVLPSDHYILDTEENTNKFYDALEVAIEFASQRKSIVTLGITPTRPETNYGYIQIKREVIDLSHFYEKGIRRSITFAEKPDYETARRFLATGEFLWNTGIYVMKVSTFWSATQACAAEIYTYFSTLRNIAEKPQFDEAVIEVFNLIPPISFDIGIMEKVQKEQEVYAVEGTFVWSDVGTWDEIYRLSEKDADYNNLKGKVFTIDTTNCLVQANEKPIALIGVENLVVIDSTRALLICKRGQTNRVAEIVSYLRRRKDDTSLL